MKEFQKGKESKQSLAVNWKSFRSWAKAVRGVVYKVNYNGKPLALKWYFGNKLNNADKFYRNIQNNIKQGLQQVRFCGL